MTASKSKATIAPTVTSAAKQISSQKWLTPAPIPASLRNGVAATFVNGGSFASMDAPQASGSLSQGVEVLSDQQAVEVGSNNKNFTTEEDHVDTRIR
jgi:hypothetical protein